MRLNLDVPSPLQYFASLVQSDAQFPMLEAAISLAQDEYPDLDVQQILSDVDQLQARLKRRLPADASALQKLKSALAGKKKAKSNDTVEYQKLAMDSEDTRGKADDKPVQQALVTLRKSSFSFRDVLGDGGKGATSSR